MVRFASPEWIAALDEAVRAVPSAGAVNAGTSPVRVRYRFTAGADTADGDASEAGPGAPVGYDLVLAAVVRAEPCDATLDATVTITQPLAVARAIATGRLAAQQALLDGSVHIEGRATELTAWRATLDALDAATAALRADTT